MGIQKHAGIEQNELVPVGDMEFVAPSGKEDGFADPSVPLEPPKEKRKLPADEDIQVLRALMLMAEDEAIYLQAVLHSNQATTNELLQAQLNVLLRIFGSLHKESMDGGD